MPELLEFSDTLRVRFKRRIAEGGMGSIYEATLYGPEGFEKTVCIKKIREEYVRDPEFVARFVGEAKLVADLVHQNIVQIYKLGRVGNEYYIMMEYVHGVNLQEFVAQHVELGLKMPVDLATFIVSRVCRGLEYAHNKKDKYGRLLNVVHRDISPRNVMISSEGEVKITDFGVAKTRHMTFDDETETVVGKLSYMSPEQAQFQPTDKRSDIYSLGVVSHELFTLKKLYDLPSDTRVALDYIITKDFPRPRVENPEVPESIERIILKALEKDIHKRYQDPSEMGYDLEYYMYHDRYGPTIQTLERYMRQLFPKLYEPTEKLRRDETTNKAQVKIPEPIQEDTTKIYGKEK